MMILISCRRCTTNKSLCTTWNNNNNHSYCDYSFTNWKSPYSYDLSKVWCDWIFIKSSLVFYMWFYFIYFCFFLFNKNSCHAEIQTRTRREPGLIAYVSGFVIALMGYVFEWYVGFFKQLHQHFSDNYGINQSSSVFACVSYQKWLRLITNR